MKLSSNPHCCKGTSKMPSLVTLALLLLTLLAGSSHAQEASVASEAEEEPMTVTGPVDIPVGRDPDQFDMGWSDGICYLPVENARPGDKLVFNSFVLHNVYRMPSSKAMEDCDFSDATLLSSSFPYKYTLKESDAVVNEDGSKSLYFACEVSSHCFGEQRVQVNLDIDTPLEEPRLKTELPASRFILGTSSSSCEAVRYGKISVGAASRGGESMCSEPELREPTKDIDRPHYFRSCLGPPITLTPGGVINQALVLNFPFPTDRRVLLGTRMWEFVQGDLDNLQPVEINQLYIHHIAGSVVLGNGAENIRQSDEDAAFDLPYGVLSGDIDDRMIFHLIDLRETGDDWLECLECRCKDGEGSYLGFGGSGSEGGPEGGVSCCTNCTDLVTPTVDYRLRYNVTYTDLSEIDTPITPIISVSADVATAIDRYVEWDVPAYTDMPPEHALDGNPKIQVIEREGTIRDLFGGFFPGARYRGSDLVEIHRCIGHMHIAALGMWLYDSITGEVICHNNVEYGNDPQVDKGFLKTISVQNYDPPLEILADRKVKLITHYDANILHTGVMGLQFLFIAEKKQEVGVPEAALNADLCVAPKCQVEAVLPNGGCRNALADSIICTFGGVCECDILMDLKETVGGCGGTYISNFGNVSVGSLCAEHCGCGEDLLEDSVVEQIREETKDLCRYAGPPCTEYLANVYACAQPWAVGTEEFDDSVMSILAKRGKEMALKGSQLGSKSMHRFDPNAIKDRRREISECDPAKYDFSTLKVPETVKETAAQSEGGGGFHPLYLFPVVVVALLAALGVYAYVARNKRRANKSSPDFVDVAVRAENA